MMKKIISALLIICCGISCKFKAVLECQETITQVEQFILCKYKPDSISIAIKTWTDGVSSIPNSIVIDIYNPTTTVLDFKTLPLNDYQKIPNMKEKMDYLEHEGYDIAKLLVENCNLSTDFNNIIVVFLKKDTQGYSRYQIMYSYSELLKQ